jgi:predicted ArsR family transcriptional regulator
VKAQVYSDEQFIDALKEILENPVGYANEVADIVGCHPRKAGERLQALADKGLLVSERRPRGIAFKFP